jgi:Radical SAM superfamily.
MDDKQAFINEEKKIFDIRKKRLYSHILFEIVGFCNAKCKYCITGRENHPKGGIVDVDNYDRALKKLLDHGLVDNKTLVSLYSWGEPTLHPQLGQILDITQNKYGFTTRLSTNAGKTIDYQKEWFTNLKSLTISMCGFSQDSYDRIHKFDFEKVKSNIINIVKVAKKARYKTERIYLVHHIYQFNIHEVPLLKKFAEKLRVSYSPYFAFLNDPKLFRGYVNNQLSLHEMKEISSEIFCHHIDERLKNHPRDNCRLFDDLTIDEKCDVITCCGIERDHEDYRITNIFDNDFIEKLESWRPPKSCLTCIASGMSPLQDVKDSIFFPKELYQHVSMFQYLKQKGKEIERRIRHTVRGKKESA